jgi:Protein of unknown function (DUF1579)
MSTSNADKAPARSRLHDALDAFVGEWRAVGTSFGGTDQTGENPKANGERWGSTHVARWHPGEFFLIQNERALIDGKPFDTLSVMGVDPEGESYFARTFDNHGFYRHYHLAVDNNIWLLEGDTERARTVFGDDRQTITWEWLRDGRWLPLCDRVATRINP